MYLKRLCFVLTIVLFSCNSNPPLIARFSGKVYHMFSTPEVEGKYAEDAAYYLEFTDKNTGHNYGLKVTEATYNSLHVGSYATFDLGLDNLKYQSEFDNGTDKEIEDAISINYTLSQPKVILDSTRR